MRCGLIGHHDSHLLWSNVVGVVAVVVVAAAVHGMAATYDWQGQGRASQ